MCSQSQLEGQWSEVLLTSLYNITGQQAERQAYEVGSCVAVREPGRHVFWPVPVAAGVLWTIPVAACLTLTAHMLQAALICF